MILNDDLKDTMAQVEPQQKLKWLVIVFKCNL